MSARTPIRRFLAGFAAALALVGVAALAVLGWRWAEALVVEEVLVSGLDHATPDEVGRLLALEDSARMVELDPDALADRVRRHPWVADVAVTRRPTGVLAVHVTERAPAALALNAAGRPAFYLDADGYRMPLAPRPVPADVPLVRGAVGGYEPLVPVADPAYRALLAALAEAPALADALVSDVVREADGQFTAWVGPTPAGAAVPVRLGRQDFAANLRRLEGFWRQAVLPRPGVRLEALDLRFRDQIVTREAPVAASASPQPALAATEPNPS